MYRIAFDSQIMHDVVRMNFITKNGLFYLNQKCRRPTAANVYGFSMVQWGDNHWLENLPENEEAISIAISLTIEQLDLISESDFKLGENHLMTMDTYKTPPTPKMFRTQGDV